MKQFSSQKGLYYGTIFILTAILIVLTILAFTLSKNTPKEKSKIQETKNTISKTNKLKYCFLFIPEALQSISRKNYTLAYTFDGSVLNSNWEATSQPLSTFSLKDLPKVFLILNEEGKFQACGTNLDIEEKKAKELQAVMKQIECNVEKRFLSFAKDVDNTQIIQILSPESKLTSIKYEADLKIDQEKLACK